MPRAVKDNTSSTPSEPPPIDPRRDLLRKAGLRVTDVRLRVIERLEQSSGALTAQQVFDAVAGAEHSRADRVTVYRTLNALVERGLAHKVDPGDRVFRFQLTDHARCTHENHDHEHPHFVCDACGQVECLDGAEVVVKSPVPQIDTPPRVLRQNVVLHGTCGGCVLPAPRSRRSSVKKSSHKDSR